MESGSIKMEKAALEAPCHKVLSPDILAAYVGTYELHHEEDWLKTMTVRLVGAHLYLDLKDYAALEMCPDGGDAFIVRRINRRLLFVRDRMGKVLGLRIADYGLRII